MGCTFLRRQVARGKAGQEFRRATSPFVLTVFPIPLNKLLQPSRSLIRTLAGEHIAELETKDCASQQRSNGVCEHDHPVAFKHSVNNPQHSPMVSAESILNEIFSVDFRGQAFLTCGIYERDVSAAAAAAQTCYHVVDHQPDLIDTIPRYTFVTSNSLRQPCLYNLLWGRRREASLFPRRSWIHPARFPLDPHRDGVKPTSGRLFHPRTTQQQIYFITCRSSPDWYPGQYCRARWQKDRGSWMRT